MDWTDHLYDLDQQCQKIILSLSTVDLHDLPFLVEKFANSGNVYILRGLSGRLADASAGVEAHLLAFPLIERLAGTPDVNVLTNLMTAVSRLEQAGAD